MNLKKPVLFIDADECLLGWLGAFCAWYNKRHDVNYLIYPEQFTDYAMSCFPGGEENRVKLIKEFSYTAEYADLNALVSMTSLEALVNVGYELRVLTARADPHPNQRAKLVHNLSRKYGPVFSGVHFVPPGTTITPTSTGYVKHPYSKAEFLLMWQAEHNHRHVVGLVDDKPDTLHRVGETNFRAFGIMHNFNRQEWDWNLCNSRPNTKINWFDTVDQVAELLVREAMSDG